MANRERIFPRRALARVDEVLARMKQIEREHPDWAERAARRAQREDFVAKARAEQERETVTLPMGPHPGCSLGGTIQYQSYVWQESVESNFVGSRPIRGPRRNGYECWCDACKVAIGAPDLLLGYAQQVAEYREREPVIPPELQDPIAETSAEAAGPTLGEESKK